jgi:energy-coupling factor transporter ATP-binding protein EcfA2
MNIVEKIFNWQKDLPDWQSDLLRRLLFKEPVSEKLEELYLNLKIESGLSPGKSTSIRLSKSELPAFDDSTSKVTLLKAHSLKNINAIKDNEELEFLPDGITVIYGENGSGKSGYARLLKKACRSRDKREHIHGNAFSDSSLEKFAKFDFQSDSNVLQYEWKIDGPSDDQLSKIAVFDSTCARILVNDKNEVEYVPYGADIFKSLGEAVSLLKKKLDSEKKSPPKRPDEIEKIAEQSPVKDLLTSLNKFPNAAEGFESFKLSEIEKTEFENLSKIADPIRLEATRKEVERKSSAINRIDFVKTQMEFLKKSLSKESLDALFGLWTNAKDARSVANEALKGFESLKKLNGIGSETWRNLFTSAAAYSKEYVYGSSEFPNTESGSVCVLCHQILSDEAKSRFSDFNAFIANKAEVEANRVKQEFVERLAGYKNNELEVLKNYSDVEGMVAEKFPEWKSKYRGFIEECEKRRRAILAASKGGDWASIPINSFESTDEIDKVITHEKSNLDTYSVLLKEGSTRENLAKFHNLASRKVLERHTQYLNEVFDIQKINALIEVVSKKLSTKKISDFAGEVVSELITEEFRMRLQNEFDSLLVNQLHVALRQSIQYGKISYYLVLNIPGSEKIPPSEILSEGEQKIVAIASFLAEISAFGHSSGIIFDDPVSSLDQKWKTKIARRLAEEGRVRQVVVFTHDISFAIELQKSCTNLSVGLQLNSLTKIGRQAGVRESEHPWPLLDVKKRIRYLKAEHKRLEVLHRSEGDLKYRRELGDVYSLLRSTWERSYEESVLNLSIVRFRSGIETNRIKEVCIPDEYYKPILDGMTRCSEITDSHDEAADKGMSFPSPAELATDIDTLDSFVSQCNQNRERIRKEREIFVPKPINMPS